MAISWATKRKLSYFSGLVALLAIVVGIPLFVTFYKKPTCFDNKQNGTEIGVDCGGSCTQLCKALELNPVVLWQQKFKIAPGYYSVAAYVQNPNLSAEAKDVNYTFTLYDSGNVKIAERKGKTYIPAGKNFVVFEGTINVGESIPARITFDFSDDFIWKVVRNTNSKLIVHNPLIFNASTSPRIEAGIENPTFNNIDRVDVTALVYNLDGNAVAASRTFLSNLQKKSEQQVVFTWPYPFPLQGVACEVPADIILGINRSSTMAADQKNPPEPLTTAKKAANAFLQQVKGNSHVGLVSFATNATTEQTLTGTISDVERKLNAITISTAGTQYTNVDDALAVALAELTSERGNANAKKVVVLLTDGISNYPVKKDDPLFGATQALVRASQVKEQGILIYTIGLGSNINPTFLRGIASSPEQYYQITTSKELAAVYKEIGSSICRQGPVRVEIIPDIPVR